MWKVSHTRPMPTSHPVSIGTLPVPTALPQSLSTVSASNLWSDIPALPSTMEQTASIITPSSSAHQNYNQPLPRVDTDISIGPLLAGLTMMVIMRRHR
jgi:hypothetical protein